MPELTSEMIAACGRCAEKFGVSEKLHPDDFLFWAIEEVTKPADKSVAIAAKALQEKPLLRAGQMPGRHKGEERCSLSPYASRR
jgi:hypothetical protein